MNSRNSVLPVVFVFCYSQLFCDGTFGSRQPGRKQQQEDKVQLFVYSLHAGGCSLVTHWSAQTGGGGR